MLQSHRALPRVSSAKQARSPSPTLVSADCHCAALPYPHPYPPLHPAPPPTPPPPHLRSPPCRKNSSNRKCRKNSTSQIRNSSSAETLRGRIVVLGRRQPWGKPMWSETGEASLALHRLPSLRRRLCSPTSPMISARAARTRAWVCERWTNRGAQIKQPPSVDTSWGSGGGWMKKKKRSWMGHVD